VNLTREQIAEQIQGAYQRHYGSEPSEVVATGWFASADAMLAMLAEARAETLERAVHCVRDWAGDTDLEVSSLVERICALKGQP
jgi:hypothetical protein